MNHALFIYFFYIKSLESIVPFCLITHLVLDQSYFKCSVGAYVYRVLYSTVQNLRILGLEKPLGSSKESQTVDSQAQLQPMAPFVWLPVKKFFEHKHLLDKDVPSGLPQSLSSLSCYQCYQFYCLPVQTNLQYLAGATKAQGGRDLSKVNSQLADPGREVRVT